MSRRNTIYLVLGLLSLAGFLATAGAQQPQPVAKSAVQLPPVSKVPPTAETAWGHAPYEAGECSLCHEKDDPKAPGPITAKVDELCFACHEGVQELLAASQFAHLPAKASCSYCHNPHNSKQPKGLTQQALTLCLECHSDIAQLMKTAKTAHGALTDRLLCLNCHNPHASNVEKLLVQLPYDMCVNCHGDDSIKDQDGKKLTNFKKLLSDNMVAHGPVAAKDCTGCHQPHGGDKFRMLVLDYPAKFYSPYDMKNYELCFTCHGDQMVTNPQTTTDTGFRDGSRNLDFVHVNKLDNGRTCRACHEVHAAPQAHIIRTSVPYGSKGWLLPINYDPTENGGQCTKTCHPTRVYDRSKVP